MNSLQDWNTPGDGRLQRHDDNHLALGKKNQQSPSQGSGGIVMGGANYQPNIWRARIAQFQAKRASYGTIAEQGGLPTNCHSPMVGEDQKMAALTPNERALAIVNEWPRMRQDGQSSDYNLNPTERSYHIPQDTVTVRNEDEDHKSSDISGSKRGYLQKDVSSDDDSSGRFDQQQSSEDQNENTELPDGRDPRTIQKHRDFEALPSSSRPLQQDEESLFFGSDADSEPKRPDRIKKQSGSSSLAFSQSNEQQGPIDINLLFSGQQAGRYTPNRDDGKPKNLPLLVWNALIGLLCFSSSFEYAVASAFYQTYTGKEKETFSMRNNLFLLLFSLDLIICFLILYLGKIKGAGSRSKVQQNQFRIGLAVDILLVQLFDQVLPLLPFELLSSSHYFYLIKTIRVIRGFRVLDIGGLVNFMKMQQIKRIRKQMHNSKEQFTKVSDIVMLANLLKTVQLVLMIIILSFFTGIFFYIFVLFGNNYLLPEDDQTNFKDEYDLDSSSWQRIAMLLTYYSFTTLSTVGLGDFHPKNSSERVFIAFIMLFGVMITSYLIESFSKIVDLLKNFNQGFSDSYNLNLFLATLNRFNHYQLSEDTEYRYRDYFKYRWSHNKNLAVSTSADQQLLEELPKELVVSMYTEYLFSDFMERFKRVFNFQFQTSFRRGNFLRKLSLDMRENIPYFEPAKMQIDLQCQDFLIAFLQYLEPVHLAPGNIMLKPNSTVSLAYFVASSHTIQVGYLNVRQSYKLMQKRMNQTIEKMALDSPREQQQKFKFQNLMQMMNSSMVSEDQSRTKVNYVQEFPCSNNPVGLFEMTFNQVPQFYYRLKCLEDPTRIKHLRPFFIRRTNWTRLWNQFSEGDSEGKLEQFKSELLIRYIIRVYFPMKEAKESKVETGEQLRKARRSSLIRSAAASSFFSSKQKRAPIGIVSQLNQSNNRLGLQEADDGASTVMNMSVRVPSKAIIQVKSINEILNLIKKRQLTQEHAPRRTIYRLFLKKLNENKEQPSTEDDLEDILEKVHSLFEMNLELLENYYEVAGQLKAERSKFISAEVQYEKSMARCEARIAELEGLTKYKQAEITKQNDNLLDLQLQINEQASQIEMLHRENQSLMTTIANEREKAKKPPTSTVSTQIQTGDFPNQVSEPHHFSSPTMFHEVPKTEEQSPLGLQPPPVTRGSGQVTPQHCDKQRYQNEFTLVKKKEEMLEVKSPVPRPRGRVKRSSKQLLFTKSSKNLARFSFDNDSHITEDLQHFQSGASNDFKIKVISEQSREIGSEISPIPENITESGLSIDIKNSTQFGHSGH